MTASDEPGMYQLIYRSRSALAGSEASVDSEVQSIVRQSDRNNRRDGVTGGLIFTASMFIQVLEGRCADVERTFERICCDIRHIGVELMSFSSVPERMFRDWHMHRAHADSKSEALFRRLSEATTTEGSTADAISKAVALMAASATKKLAEAADQASN